MNSSDARRIVLTRAIEETVPEAVTPEMQIDALHAAGAVRDEVKWIARRAHFLTAGPLSAYQPLLAMSYALNSAGGLVVVGGIAAGLVVNYLGPSRQIHALYNPICALIVWNLGVYMLLIVKAAASRMGLGWNRFRVRDRGIGSSMPEDAATAEEGNVFLSAFGPGAFVRWTLRRSVPALWMRFHRAASDARAEAEEGGRVAKAFWSLWVPVAGPLFALGARRLLNFGAIGLALGATAGMFVRGLFLD